MQGHFLSDANTAKDLQSRSGFYARFEQDAGGKSQPMSRWNRKPTGVCRAEALFLTISGVLGCVLVAIVYGSCQGDIDSAREHFSFGSQVVGTGSSLVCKR